MYDFHVCACMIALRNKLNGSPYLSFIVRQYMQMAYDRKVVEIKKFPSMVT